MLCRSNMRRRIIIAALIGVVALFWVGVILAVTLLDGLKDAVVQEQGVRYFVTAIAVGIAPTRAGLTTCIMKVRKGQNAPAR